MNFRSPADSGNPIHPISLLVVSCDKYSDLWKPFFELFRVQWPNCPYPLFLGTNRKIYPGGYVTSLPIGEDISWASGVLRMLDRIDAQHVILFLEDFLIRLPVDTSAIERYVEIAVKENVGCLRLFPYPPPSRHLPDYVDVGSILPGDLYRVSTQAAIWRVDTLRRLLIPGFTAWDFELTGSQLSNALPDAFWSVWEPALAYLNGVERGKWRPQGLSLCREANVEVDLTARSVLTEEDITAYQEKLGIEKLKHEALEHFMAGRRIRGLGSAIRHLFRQPFALPLWGIVLFGLLGPSPLAWLKSKHFRARIERYYKKWGNEH
jgi:hypothetical protein